MPRSKKKGPVLYKSILKQIKNAISSSSKEMVIKTKQRSATILTNFIGISFAVYNGKTYVEFKITESMVGHKLGEFSWTRNFKSHKMSKA